MLEKLTAATISGAAASITATNATSVSLVLVTPGFLFFGPTETVLPMTVTRTVTPNISEFSLGSAAALVGKEPQGTGVSLNGTTGIPSVVSGFVDLRFGEGVSDVTQSDGEFTLEYLSRGMNFISLPGTAGQAWRKCETLHGGAGCMFPIDLQSNRTDLDFRQEN